MVWHGMVIVATVLYGDTLIDTLVTNLCAYANFCKRLNPKYKDCCDQTESALPITRTCNGAQAVVL